MVKPFGAGGFLLHPFHKIIDPCNASFPVPFRNRLASWFFLPEAGEVFQIVRVYPPSCTDFMNRLRQLFVGLAPIDFGQYGFKGGFGFGSGSLILNAPILFVFAGWCPRTSTNRFFTLRLPST